MTVPPSGGAEELRLIGEPALDLARSNPHLWRHDAAGLTPLGMPLRALVHADAYDLDSRRLRVLVVGGITGRPNDVRLALALMRRYAAVKSVHERVALTGVVCANPEAASLGSDGTNSAGGNVAHGYPPQDGYFNDARSPEARYLWRWICFQAPDLVVDLRFGDAEAWDANAAGSPPSADVADPAGAADSLVRALWGSHPPAPGTIPAVQLTLSASDARSLDGVWTRLGTRDASRSEAARELQRRQHRTALEASASLAARYGEKLAPVVYTQGVAISGRLRHARLSGDYSHVEPARRLVEPIVSGQKQPFSERAGGQDLAGVVWCDDLYRMTNDRRYLDLLVSAADHYVSAPDRRPPPPADRDFRTEDMFFAAAVLGRAFSLTSREAYASLLAPYLQVCVGQQQEDGLFWHSESVKYYWGRGNTFAALGFAEALTYLPASTPGIELLIASHRKHLRSMIATAAPSGALRQVLDVPGPYEELSATCMAGYAVARGIRLGWLEQAEFAGPLDRLWKAALGRIDKAGGLVDVCTGTGPQPSLKAYLDRAAISGYDDRGGSLASWFATEMLALEMGQRA